jgi:acetyltransferase-like isoleucine patch superfamily enzyme
MISTREVLERLVRRLKRDPTYRIASELTDRQLALILWYRGRQYVRGLPLRLIVPGVRGAVFRGRRVVVEHAHQLASAGPLILEDEVWINALSDRGVVLGANVTIARGAALTCTGVIAHRGVGMRIGSRSAVGAQSFLAGQGGIDIGDDVLMGPGVRIFSENHAHADIDRPMRTQGEIRAAVSIQDDCWIGAGTTILAGVTIGRGSIVAAGSVVTRDLPPFSVAAGVPARVVRSRRERSAESDRQGLLPVEVAPLAQPAAWQSRAPTLPVEAGSALPATRTASTGSPAKSPLLREIE